MPGFVYCPWATGHVSRNPLLQYTAGPGVVGRDRRKSFRAALPRPSVRNEFAQQIAQMGDSDRDGDTYLRQMESGDASVVRFVVEASPGTST